MDSVDRLSEKEVTELYGKYSSKHFIEPIDLKRLALKSQLKLCDKYENFIKRYTEEKKDYELNVVTYHFERTYKCEILRKILLNIS